MRNNSLLRPLTEAEKATTGQLAREYLEGATMAKQAIGQRLAQLERSAPGEQQTAADLIAMLQRRPKTADEFVIWERNLSDLERAAYMEIVDRELITWRQSCGERAYG